MTHDPTRISDAVYRAVSRVLLAVGMAGLLAFLISLYPPAWWVAVVVWVLLAVPAVLLVAPVAGGIGLLAGALAWGASLVLGAISRRSRA